MKKIVLLLIALSSGMLLFGETINVRYDGIRPDDPDGRHGLANPERGFRWENRFGSSRPEWSDQRWLAGIKARSKDGLTVTQAYCELLAYAKTPEISAEQIKLLENSFTVLRENGLKALLCFRYEMNTNQEGPTEEIILAHINQLKPLLRKNMDVIAVLQAGFIGLYGEWHRSYHKLERNPEAQQKILTALLDVLPPDRKMVIRYPRHKNSFVMRVSGRHDHQPITLKEAHTMRPEARIGFADHGFMVGENDAGTFAPRPSKDYDYMTQESLFVPMEGELFWAFNRPWGIAKDDGLEAIRRLWEHHYTLFSYAHNHSLYEGLRWKEELNARYSLDEWKEEEVKPEFLKENNIPFSEDYFRDTDGNSVARTIFEYIRDHLGYRLALIRGEYQTEAITGQSYNAEFTLVNHGFAAPVNPRPVYLVLIDQNKPQLIGKADTDVREWYPCDPINRKELSPPYRLKFSSVSFPEVKPGQYLLGLWLPDGYESLRHDSRYSVRLANRNVPWWQGDGNLYGINVVGKITVK